MSEFAEFLRAAVWAADLAAFNRDRPLLRRTIAALEPDLWPRLTVAEVRAAIDAKYEDFVGGGRMAVVTMKLVIDAIENEKPGFHDWWARNHGANLELSCCLIEVGMLLFGPGLWIKAPKERI